MNLRTSGSFGDVSYIVETNGTESCVVIAKSKNRAGLITRETQRKLEDIAADAVGMPVLASEGMAQPYPITKEGKPVNHLGDQVDAYQLEVRFYFR